MGRCPWAAMHPRVGSNSSLTHELNCTQTTLREAASDTRSPRRNWTFGGAKTDILTLQYVTVLTVIIF